MFSLTSLRKLIQIQKLIVVADPFELGSSIVPLSLELLYRPGQPLCSHAATLSTGAIYIRQTVYLATSYLYGVTAVGTQQSTSVGLYLPHSLLTADSTVLLGSLRQSQVIVL
jgi:hypothetical protein